MNDPTKTGMMRIAGHEFCNHCDGRGYIVNRGCRYSCTICAGTGAQPIFVPAEGVTVTFDDPDKGVTA